MLCGHQRARPLKTYAEAIQSLDDESAGIGFMGEQLLNDVKYDPCLVDALSFDFVTKHLGDEIKKGGETR